MRIDNRVESFQLLEEEPTTVASHQLVIMYLRTLQTSIELYSVDSGREIRVVVRYIHYTRRCGGII